MNCCSFLLRRLTSYASWELRMGRPDGRKSTVYARDVMQGDDCRSDITRRKMNGTINELGGRLMGLGRTKNLLEKMKR
jgi:hypothetical protein